MDITPGTKDPCGHGTRTAGVIGAPNDGRSVVGIAWKSDLRIVNVASRGFSTDPSYYDHVISVDPARVYEGLQKAMGEALDLATKQYVRVRAPAHIINMSFKTYNDPVNGSYPNTVADLIRYYYYSSGGPLFVGAIGTLPIGMPNAVFPAEMEEVVAVVALNPDGSRNGESNYGPAAELAAYIPVATVDVPSMGGASGITRIMGASGAAATISGLATLVWARYPWLTNTQVRSRLRQFADHPFNHNWSDGYGYVDVYGAVGGFTNMRMEVKDCATPLNPTIEAQAVATGDGPFTYQWSNGATSASTAYTAAPAGDSIHVWVLVSDVVENRSVQDTKWVRTVTNEDPHYVECLTT
ncbi:MAG: S8 family serine peptidase [Gemmatimonadota bacterium]